MVHITNGFRTTKVTKGAFKELYEPNGWRIVVEKEEKSSHEELPEVVHIEEERAKESPEKDIEEALPEEVEIPLSEMTVKELKQLAKDNGIDIELAKSKKELIDTIKAEMGD